jgi:hypothetical protein
MTNRYYHGARTELALRDLIAPSATEARDPSSAHVLLTPNLDEAIWSAELAAGDAPARVYVVEPLGPVAPVSLQPEYRPPGHPTMCWCSRAPLRVTGEVTEWLYYHGTRADLQPGDLIKPGHVSNFGAIARRRTTSTSLARSTPPRGARSLPSAKDAAASTSLSRPDPPKTTPTSRTRSSVGIPPSRSRSREPLRIKGEVSDWQGHAKEAIQTMKDGLERRKQLGVDAIDD